MFSLTNSHSKIYHKVKNCKHQSIFEVQIEQKLIQVDQYGKQNWFFPR